MRVDGLDGAIRQKLQTDERLLKRFAKRLLAGGDDEGALAASTEAVSGGNE